MKFILSGLWVGYIFIALNAHAQIPANDTHYSNNDSSLKTELKNLSSVWMDAMLKHDSVTLNKLMAPGYALHSWDGNASNTMPRAGWLYNLFNNIIITRWQQSAVSVQVYGNFAVITSLYEWAGSFSNRPFDSKGYIADIWVRKNKQWQVVSRTAGAIPGSKTIDGKEVK